MRIALLCLLLAAPAAAHAAPVHVLTDDRLAFAPELAAGPIAHLAAPVDVIRADFQPVVADAAAAPSVASQLGGQLAGLAIAIVLAPLLGVLAHKYLPAAEKKADDEIDSLPFFKQHQRIGAFAKAFAHQADLSLINLADKLGADAKSEGKFDAALTAKAKQDVIDEGLIFLGQSKAELADALGFPLPALLDSYLNKLLGARVASLKASGHLPSDTAPAPVAQVP